MGFYLRRNGTFCVLILWTAPNADFLGSPQQIHEQSQRISPRRSDLTTVVQKGFKAHYARVSQTKEKPMQAFDRYYWTTALALGRIITSFGPVI
jgi:hypothetical protein